ncbi:arsenite methyltransferase [Serinicoccus kebangsaanensis]|uniref:arsenite methyltransferase n=1 Tax=Serinicoccus kebangsaanensis TaxID=2602069 RepID=UPI00124CF54A|nr:arsenite methyltransferase [Serinicoccus kebangsaanensis]
MTDHTVRDAVRRRYAEAARAIDSGTAPRPAPAAPDQDPAGCCGPSPDLGVLTPPGVFGTSLYDGDPDASRAGLALEGSLGCGVPTAVAELHEGETVLDLGSGAGADVLISAGRVGSTGRAIGLDMTPEMVELARRNAAEAGVTNVEFHEGYLEDVPLPDASVDVVISNCVINLAADKAVVLREAYRVLRPGGRLAISDVVAHHPWPEELRAEVEQWTGCISGALVEEDYRRLLREAGFEDVRIETTHEVHALASAAVVRATRPTGD